MLARGEAFGGFSVDDIAAAKAFRGLNDRGVRMERYEGMEADDMKRPRPGVSRSASGFRLPAV